MNSSTSQPWQTLNDPDRTVLLAVAAPKEADWVARGLGHAAESFPLWTPVPIAPGVALVRTGVGPAAACGAVSRVLDPSRHAAVVSLGIAGAVPGEGSPAIGVSMLATRSEFVDLGLLGPARFESVAEMGFGTTEFGDIFRPHATLAAQLTPVLDHTGPIATVSICSGTDRWASFVRERLGSPEGPAAEAMEGAAVGLAAAMVGVPFAEVRVISNTTGDRDGQEWDLPGAFTRLAETAARMAGALTPSA